MEEKVTILFFLLLLQLVEEQDQRPGLLDMMVVAGVEGQTKAPRDTPGVMETLQAQAHHKVIMAEKDMTVEVLMALVEAAALVQWVGRHQTLMVGREEVARHHLFQAHP